MIKHFKIVTSISLIVAILAFFGYGAIEPQLARAVTDQVVITLNVLQEISISDAGNTTMSRSLGVSAMGAVATTTWTVITNDSAGYTLNLLASTDPAMKSGSLEVADYQRNAPNTWNATSGSAYFGYSGYGTDTSTGTWGTGSACSGTGGPHATSTTLKYQGFKTTSASFDIASRAATTTPAGVATTVCYAVEQKDYFIPTNAATTTYTATITATATAL